jgi:hypothetical protein
MVKLLIAAVCLFLIQTAGRAEEPAADPIVAKITAAKDTFYAERDKAEQALIVLLEKKEASAKQAGDLKVIEAVRAESDAFRKEGILPKLVPLTVYEAAMKLARTKLENNYLAAIKDYIKQDKLDEAKILQTALDELRAGPKKNLVPNDPFPAKSVWVSEQGGEDSSVLTVLQRKEDKFEGQITSQKVDRLIFGTVSNGKVSWDAKDVKALKGSKGPNNVGTFETDEKGPLIKLRWYGGGKSGGSTYRLKK